MSVEPAHARVDLHLPAAVITEIAEVAAGIVVERLRRDAEEREQDASPYLTGWAAAAAYTGISESTLKHDDGVPRHKVGGVVVFRRDELDAWLDACYEGSKRYRRSNGLGSITVPFRPSGRPRDSLAANKNPA